MLVKSQDESSGVEKIIVQQEDGTKLELEGAEGSVYLPLAIREGWSLCGRLCRTGKCEKQLRTDHL